MSANSGNGERTTIRRINGNASMATPIKEDGKTTEGLTFKQLTVRTVILPERPFCSAMSETLVVVVFCKDWQIYLV